MSSQHHQSDPKVLDRRTLQRDHRVLAGLLRPGMAVLDVGCGTGAISRGIALAVGTSGSVVGVDRDRGLIERARAANADVTNLRFVEADVASLIFADEFDIVTAARTLQWIADLDGALRAMTRAAKPGGLLIVLDYNHALNAWDPAPPAPFAEFYERFLSWREANGWDNEVANHSAALFGNGGLQQVRVLDQTEAADRSSEAFDQAAGLWLEVIDRLGPTLATAGACDAALLDTARTSYDEYRRTTLRTVTLAMKATVGRTSGVRGRRR